MTWRKLAAGRSAGICPMRRGPRTKFLTVCKMLRHVSLTDIITVARINLLMLLDKLRGRRVIILDLEESILVPFLSPVVDVLQRSTFRLTFFAAFKKLFFG